MDDACARPASPSATCASSTTSAPRPSRSELRSDRRAVGLELTIFDPALDADGVIIRTLVARLGALVTPDGCARSHRGTMWTRARRAPKSVGRSSKGDSYIRGSGVLGETPGTVARAGGRLRLRTRRLRRGAGGDPEGHSA